MKTLKIIGLLLVVLTACIAGLGYYLFANMCEYTVISSFASPNNQWQAVLFERSCGATTGFTSQVSIIESGDSLSNVDSGNIYIAEGYPKGYLLTWESAKTLQVTGGSGKIYKKEQMHKGVSISYE